jgi:hypothetical protein
MFQKKKKKKEKDSFHIFFSLSETLQSCFSSFEFRVGTEKRVSLLLGIFKVFSPVMKKKQARCKNTGFISHLCGENRESVRPSRERPLNLSSLTCPRDDIAHWKNVSLGRLSVHFLWLCPAWGGSRILDLRFLQQLFSTAGNVKTQAEQKRVGRGGEDRHGTGSP